MARLTRIAGVAASLAIVYAANVGVATRIRASGGPFNPPSAVVPGVSDLAASRAHTFFAGGPYAVAVGEYTYMGGVTSTGGHGMLDVVETATRTVVSSITLHASLDDDDHVNPIPLVRPDGRLQAFYAQHEPLSTTMWSRVSVSTLADDPTLADGFNTEVSLDAQLLSGSYDYPVPIYLSAEGLSYLFWRNIPSGSSYRIWYSTSADGDTWSAGTELFRNITKTNRAYWQIRSNGVDRIDFAVTDGSPNTDTTHLGHFYYDGAWRQTDGTDMGAPVFNFVDVTPVYTAANTWVLDVIYDGANPRILHPTYPTEFTDHRYNESRWNGSAWAMTQITAAGNGIDSTGVYSGGIQYDPSDATLVSASIEVSGVHEIVDFQRTIETWDAGTAITSSSAEDQLRPVYPKDHGPGLDKYWMAGSYTGYEVFDTDFRGSG